MSVAETLEYWRVLDGCTGREGGALLRHLNANDRTRVAVIKWTGCRKDTEVLFYKVFGGGHRLAAIAAERNDLQQTFAKEFSDYAALSNPLPLTGKEVQALLSADEALSRVQRLDQRMLARTNVRSRRKETWRGWLGRGF